MGITKVSSQEQFNASDAHELNDNTGFANNASTVKCDSNTASGSRYNGGFHFNEFPLPAAAKIEAAWVELQCSPGTMNIDLNVDIYCHDHDNAQHFNGLTDVTDRATTTATVQWTTTEYTGLSGHQYINTPDIKALIQEIVDRGGWVNPNDIVVLLKGKSDSNHAAEFYSHVESGAFAATLHVIYSTPGTDAVPRGFNLGQ